jgi:hypothetical protein
MKGVIQRNRLQYNVLSEQVVVLYEDAPDVPDGIRVTEAFDTMDRFSADPKDSLLISPAGNVGAAGVCTFVRDRGAILPLQVLLEPGLILIERLEDQADPVNESIARLTEQLAAITLERDELAKKLAELLAALDAHAAEREALAKLLAQPPSVVVEETVAAEPATSAEPPAKM